MPIGSVKKIHIFLICSELSHKFRSWWRITFFTIALVSSIFSSQSVLAESQDEIRYKTVALYKFLNYVTLNTTKTVVCISGSEKIYDGFKKFTDARKNLKKIDEIRFITESNDSLKTCNVFFISREKRPLGEQIIKSISGRKNIISVSDIDGFVKKANGLIEIYEDDDTLKIRLNLRRAEAEKIQMSSKLTEASDDTF